MQYQIDLQNEIGTTANRTTYPNLRLLSLAGDEGRQFFATKPLLPQSEPNRKSPFFEIIGLCRA